MEVEVVVLGSPSLITLMISARGRKATSNITGFRVQELCGSRGGRPGLTATNSPYDLCGREATLNRLQSSGAV